MSENKPSSDFITALATILGVTVAFIAKLIFRGVFRRSIWTWAVCKWWCYYFALCLLLAFAPGRNFVYWLEKIPEGPFSRIGAWAAIHLSQSTQLCLLFLSPLLGWLAFIGSIELLRLRKPQIALDHLGLKTSSGLKPIVTNVFPLGEHRRKITLRAIGIDIQEFKNKKGALESGLNGIVENISVSENDRQRVEIILADRALPKMIPYAAQGARNLARPYSFLIGESLGGFLVGSLVDLHHMIIAGATGGGKSFFFKQVTVGLLESSKNIQFYLIDLKRGVEARAFTKLDNVRVAKEAPDAVFVLSAIVQEMEERFIYLEKNGLNEIEPDRDKMDRIVVAIDEASVLFTVEKSSRSTRATAEKARDLTDRIAKLGRAAAINIIIATQKVVKETIDTRVQTNINARMVFRVNTVASSMTVLGNKLASELPEIQGRGIWSVGSRDIEVQTPFLDIDEVAERLEVLAKKFERGRKSFFGPMLAQAKAEDKTNNAFEAEGVDDQVAS